MGVMPGKGDIYPGFYCILLLAQSGKTVFMHGTHRGLIQSVCIKKKLLPQLACL